MVGVVEGRSWKPMSILSKPHTYLHMEDLAQWDLSATWTKESQTSLQRKKGTSKWVQMGIWLWEVTQLCMAAR